METKLQVLVGKTEKNYELVKGNEQATKQSLIGPLFTILGYDLTDPEECIPEYKANFGKDRSTKPVDWAFCRESKLLFYVEAKEAGKDLGGYDEQLADYFAKSPEVKLGILTNGVVWKFFTDFENANIMDPNPFVQWDILNDRIPVEFLRLLQKDQFNIELIKSFASERRSTLLLNKRIEEVLNLSSDFMRLVLSKVENRKLTDSVLEGWKSRIELALIDWAREKTIGVAILNSSQEKEEDEEKNSKIETTEDELLAFETIKIILGLDKPIEFKDTQQFFKICLPGKTHRGYKGICRLFLRNRSKKLSFYINKEELLKLLPTCEFIDSFYPGWIDILFNENNDLYNYKSVFHYIYSLSHTLKEGL